MTGGPTTDGIAVIGMSGRFPGAPDLDTFWSNVRDGVESIADLTDDQLRAEGVSPSLITDPAYVRRAPVLEGIEEFDAEFFGFTPALARGTDPQLRLFLQACWHAFEDAGYDPARTGGRAGVFGTSSTSGYLLFNVLSHQDMGELLGQGATGDLVTMLGGSDPNFLATRVAFQLDLRGPALTVQTACSSSLVALHLACQSLLAGECDVALAGGVSVKVPHHVGYLHDPGSMQSADGHCRAFDASSTGTLFGSGVGAFLLKPLDAALADGDHVYAVVRGSAVNNDGSLKMGFPAPSVDGQAEVIAEALAVAGVEPESVGYVEAHGTGTPLGDPVEVAALTAAFGPRAPGLPRTAIGSVKSNIGHLDTAAGAAGFAKAVLALEHRTLPPTLHVTRPNPELHLATSPFTIQDRRADWASTGPRRAGVSALGVGGTNAHMVLEEAPTGAAPPPSAHPQVLVVSARTPDALEDAAAALATRLTGADLPDLADVAHTLAVGRRAFRHRRTVVAGSPAEAAAALTDPADPRTFGGSPAGDETEIAFLLPGQGAQYAGMTAGLYAADPLYRRHLDAIAGPFSDALGIDLGATLRDPATELLTRTDVAQAALVAVEFALAGTLADWGVRPGALAGHSVGELTAAALAGVLDLPDLVRAVVARGRLMGEAGAGAMLAVSLPEADLLAELSGGCELAAVNEPAGCVVAGPADAVADLAERLRARGVDVAPVATRYPFHTAAMGAAAERFTEVMAGLTLSAPVVPLLSNVTGTWMTAAEAVDPARWGRQIRGTVRFGGCVDALLDEPRRVLVEVGPGRTLGAAARRSTAWGDGHRLVRTTRHPAQDRDDREALLAALGELWTAGVDVDWSPAHTGRPPRRVRLPLYPFRRTSFWTGSRYADGTAPHVAAPVAPPTDATPVAPVATPPTAVLPTNPPTTAPPTTAPPATAPPTTEPEAAALLDRLWREALGVDAIDPDANFFALGGDSMLAVRIASKAARAGLRLTPALMYANQTVAGLAAAAMAAAPTPGPAPDPDVVPAVPSQLRALDAGGAFVLVLEVTTPDAERPLLARALTAVVAHHEVLRLRVADRDGLPELRIAAPADVDIPEIDSPDALTIDPAGPLLRAGHLPGEPARLVIAVHPLAADATTTTLLAADLNDACTQLGSTADVVLPPVPTRWRDWAQRITEVAADPAIQAERSVWLAADRADDRLRTPFPPGGGTADVRRVESADLDEAATAALLDFAAVGALRPVEVVLGALAFAGGSLGHARLLVEVEGAARAVPFAGVDASRTLGPATTAHPLLLDVVDDPQAGPAAALAALRAVPRRGLGYELLRTLHAPTARALATRPAADLRLTWDDAPTTTAGPLRPTGPATRPAPGGTGPAVEIRAWLAPGESGPRLALEWWCDAGRADAGAVADLARRTAGTLRALTAPDGDGDAVIDLEEFGLSSDELRVLLDVAAAGGDELH